MRLPLPRFLARLAASVAGDHPAWWRLAMRRRLRDAPPPLPAAATALERRRVVVVSHDAHPHGAQYLALHIARELATLGVDVAVVLHGEGALLEDYRRVCPCHVVDRRDAAAMDALAASLWASGYRHAVANTVVCGAFLAVLRGRGGDAIGLVHELPGMIDHYDLAAPAAAMADAARLLVFPAEVVRDRFVERYPACAERTQVRPQGLYKRSRLTDDACRAEARGRALVQLALPADARVILGVGFTEPRKGPDAFVRAVGLLAARDARVHGVWIGHHHPAFQPEVERAIAATGVPGQIHFPGRTTDTEAWYAAAEVFALTSSEDPYPSVVLEAFDAGVPVVGFAGTGGLDALIASTGGGLVAAADEAAFAAACGRLLADPVWHAEVVRRQRAHVDADTAFRPYVFDILDWLGLGLPRVSVVVPNYNYARYLPVRLRSIAAQTLPVMEVVVLDDASTDDSLAVLQRLQSEIPLPMRVVAAAANSGSPFRQWAAGAALARGDLLWIAEADDDAAPDLLATLAGEFAAAGVAMAYCQSRQIDADGAQIAPDYLDYTAGFSRERWRHPFRAGLDEELAHGFGVKNTIPNVSAVLYRADAFASAMARHGDEVARFAVAGDWLFHARVLEHGLLAYRPEALNVHRRQAAGATLATDAVRHLAEVAAVQRSLARDPGVGPATRRAASRYLRELADYFGLPADGSVADDRLRM
jgi:glycosyltransferase involved in cell wall biosynthesis/GT2 family glycosyltransferase